MKLTVEIDRKRFVQVLLMCGTDSDILLKYLEVFDSVDEVEIKKEDMEALKKIEKDIDLSVTALAVPVVAKIIEEEKNEG